MKRGRQSLRRSSLALAILSCLVLLIAAPYFIDGRNRDLTFGGAAVFAASQDSYALSTPIRLLEAPAIGLESGTLSIPPNRTGFARSGEVLAMLITGKSARIKLDNATFTADFSGKEASFSQASINGGVAPLVTSLQKLKFDSLSVRDSSIRLTMSDGTVLRLDDLTADVTAKPDGIAHAVGSFTFRGEEIKFDTTLGTKLDRQNGAARPITASLDSRLLSAKLDGSLLIGDNLRLLSPQAELTIPSLRRTARWLGTGLKPGPGLESFHLRGQLEWTNRTIAFQKATVQMDGNEASGTLSVNFAGARTAIDGTLGLKTLDLSTYLGAGDAAREGARPECLLSLLRKARGLEFPLIHALDADLRISSDSVVVPGVTIGRSAATISLKSGKMIADIAELEIDDGTRGGGQMRIDANGAQPRYDIRGKLNALDLGRAAQAIFGHPTVQGRGEVTVEITAVGSTGSDLLSSLDGKLGVTLNEGGLLGIDLNKLVAEASSPQPIGVWRAASAGAITIDKLDARFALANGIIRTESASALSGSRAMKAEGAIDLPTRSLDLELAIGDREPAGDAVEVPTRGRREVIDMHGPWTAPAVRAGTGVIATEPGNPG